MINTDKSAKVTEASLSLLPLFVNQPAELLCEVAKHARYSKFRKGDVVLASGEQASRFHIVLSGWVGSRRNNANGGEAFLEIFSNGSTFPLYGFGQHVLCTANIVALCEVKTLCFPYALLDELADVHPSFAKTLILAAQQRIDNCIDHIEQLTLRTAEQRVGAFLLQLRLDSDDHNAAIKLPFEKVVIASYLGIKPETLSRALKNLRDEGVQVCKDDIHIPDPALLCAFCDPRISRNCKDADTDECHNPISDTIAVKHDGLV